MFAQSWWPVRNATRVPCDRVLDTLAGNPTLLCENYTDVVHARLGTGFFTDSYDIFCVSLLCIMLGIVYKHDNKGVLLTPQDTAIKLSTSAGTVIGQVGFGALADIVGRKKMYGLELILIIVATLAQALTGPGPGTSIVGLIIFWRVLMGIGKFDPTDPITLNPEANSIRNRR
jgi:MFS family permease